MTDTIGKYEVVDELGVGGCGRVYRAVDPDLHRTVAIKKSIPNPDPAFRERFVREARIAAGLSHANIVTVHDFGVDDLEEPYLVQELLDGEDLDHLIARGEPRSLRLRVGLLIQIAKGLGHAHRAGVVHRDIKPGNLRVRADGELKIMDFGIARLLSDQNRLTQTGTTVGTVAYIAPEQVKGQEIDHRVDIFAFGVVAYELLTFHRPFAGETVSNVLYQILQGPTPSLAEGAPGLPSELCDIVERCLAKEPDQRPDAFEEVVEGLEQVLQTLPEEHGSTRPVAEGPDPAVSLVELDGPTTNLPLAFTPEPAPTLWTRARDVSAPVGLLALVLVALIAATLGFFLTRGQGTQTEAITVAKAPPPASASAPGESDLAVVPSGGDAASSEPGAEAPGEDVGDAPAAIDSELPVEPAGTRSAPKRAELPPQPEIVLISDDARATSELIPFLLSRFGDVPVAASLAEAGGAGRALVLETVATSSTTSSYGTTLTTCEAQVSAQLMTLRTRRLGWSETVTVTAPDCDRALEDAGAAIKDRLIVALDAPETGKATGAEGGVLHLTLDSPVDGETAERLLEALRGVPGVLDATLDGRDQVELTTDREIGALARDLDRLDGLRVTRREIDGMRVRWDG